MQCVVLFEWNRKIDLFRLKQKFTEIQLSIKTTTAQTKKFHIEDFMF